MSMVDPKGARPKIHGKSKVYELIERDRRLRQELGMKVLSALPAGLVETDQPVLETNGTAGVAKAYPIATF